MDRVKELELKIKNNADSYYSGISEITDEEFDKLVDELREISPDNPLLSQVGWGFSPRGEKVDHLYNLKVGSLSKVKTIEDLPSEFLTSNCRMSAKLDGLSVVSYYKSGRRFLSLTRGNGVQGKDVTSKINKISPQTKVLWGPYNNFTGAVRGEVLIDNDTWAREFKEYAEDPDPKHNARNIASGLLNRNEDSDLLSHMRYVVYKVVADPDRIFCEDNIIYGFRSSENFLSYYFDCVPYIEDFGYTKFNQERMEEMYEQFRHEFPCDGLVLTRRDTMKYSDEGSIEYDEVAYKFKSEEKEVVVTDVDWTMSRTGRAVPRIWFNPVALSGALVTKCTGFNAKYISDNKINIGTHLLVTRSGEVIPHIVKVLWNPCQEGKLIKTCPVCGQSLVWHGEDLVCSEENANQLAYRFISVVGETEGVGPGIFSKILNEVFKIETSEDLIKLLKKCHEDINDCYSEIDEKVSGSVTKSKCKEVINKLSSPINPVKFLVACNIKGLSWTSSTNLIYNYPEILNEIIEKGHIDLDRIYRIPGFGDAAAESLTNNFKRIQSLGQVVVIDDFKKEDNTGVDVKFEVAITGSLSMKRSDFEKLLESKGIRQGRDFKNKVKYLITNDPGKSSTKLRKAKEYGVEIISEKEFYDKFLK